MVFQRLPTQQWTLREGKFILYVVYLEEKKKGLPQFPTPAHHFLCYIPCPSPICTLGRWGPEAKMGATVFLEVRVRSQNLLSFHSQDRQRFFQIGPLPSQENFLKCYKPSSQRREERRAKIKGRREARVEERGEEIKRSSSLVY